MKKQGPVLPATARASVWCWALSGLLVWSDAAVAQNPSIASVRERQQIDELMIVDCMLPGQVRRLGTGVTYLAPRRATKTAASDCAIRGGEYVAHDRSNLATALNVWLPPAQAGDKVAQTYVGEIFEKGLGSGSDYVSAATWYKKAADQGYARALINLGFLYEQGLGVTKDPVTALNLYRKAAGIEGSINLDGAPGALRQDVDALRRELEQTRKELENSRRELDQQRLKSSGEIERLTKQKVAASASGNADETRRLEAMVKEREVELEKRRQQVAKLEQSSDEYKGLLSRLESETALLRLSLQSARQELLASQREMDAKKALLVTAERTLEATRQEIAAVKANKQSAGEAQVKALDNELKKRDEALAKQRLEIATLETDVRKNKEKVASLEARQTTRTSVAVAAPSIQIIDPSIVVTRDTATVTVRPDISTRQIVGRVLAPAGLLSFTANEVAQEVDGEGYFKTNAQISGSKTRMTFTAIDRQGKRAVVEFLVEKQGVASTHKSTVLTALPGLQLGKFYALVIGNQKYEKLRPLETPEADAKAVSDLLRQRYGFTVKTVLNATRHRIMTEINELRKTLTENDSLLIYYAGHGELDRVNSLANWLPVDADPDSNANWISSSTLTEILNAMSAKHVLIVADSCYSGALTRSSIGQLETGLSEEARINWLKALAHARSRTVLTSGGVSPVLDGGGGSHSVFASIFLDVLSANQDVLEGMRLYREISARVVNMALKFKFEQRPEYAPIRFAGGETGDFLFFPTGESSAVRDAPPAGVIKRSQLYMPRADEAL